MTRAPSPLRVRLAVAVALALVVRVLFVLFVTRNRPLGLDADSYRMLGLALRDGLGYVGPPDVSGERVATATFPPGFPTFIATAAFAGARRLIALRLALAGLGAGNVVLVALLARRVAGDRVAVVAAFLGALHLPLVTTDGSVMSESLYLTFVLLALLGAAALSRSLDLLPAILTGVAIGAAALTRSEGLMLLPFVVAPAAFLARPRRPARAALAIGVVAVIAVLSLVPWHVRNQQLYDEVVWFSGNSATAVAGASCDRHFSGPETGLWTFGCLAHPAIRDATNEAELYTALRRGAFEYQRDHLSELPRVSAIRQLRTWGLYAPVQQAEFEAPEGRVFRWQIAAWVGHLAVLVLAAVGSVVLVRRRAPMWWLAGPVAMVVVSTALTYGNQRFRVAAEPALLIAAATAIVAASDRRRAPEPARGDG
ncbi:MAG TPA: phospholipid carrier-dependent glycosyltransferase [Acidimicrobiia bacterium]|nr:phospholipid carrier-dependent glycosyltransferase [Acidimicrobiia bacterium]